MFGTVLWLYVCTEDRVSGVQVACASRRRDEILLFDLSYFSAKPEVSSMTFSLVMLTFKFKGSHSPVLLVKGIMVFVVVSDTSGT